MKWLANIGVQGVKVLPLVTQVNLGICLHKIQAKMNCPP